MFLLAENFNPVVLLIFDIKYSLVKFTSTLAGPDVTRSSTNAVNILVV